MIDSTLPGRAADDRGGIDRVPFLATHKAVAMCAREFTRLTEEVEERVEAFAGDGVEETAVVRQSPTRCIVQLGPVALTIAWLRDRLDSIEDGELLVILWRGAVARRNESRPERVSALPSLPPAVVIAEEVFVPVAQSEATWRWQPAKSDREAITSPELAQWCAERLRLELGKNSPDNVTA